MTTASDVNLPRPRKGRRTSATQQAQWQFQANLLDQLSDAVIAVDLDERITYLNRAAVAQYRVDPDSIIGQPLRQVYRYEWLQPEDELAATAALAQQGHWRGENRHLRQDGSMIHVESLVTELRDDADNAIGLLATIRDITDRKQMERDLRASELRYRRLADTLPQLVWTANATGITDYYNIHIHDFDPSVWQGSAGFAWESLLHPEDRAPTLAAWQQAVQQRRPYSCEHRLHMADGSWRWHLSRALLVQDADNGLRWYGTATDIHERKVAEEARRANQERLQLGIQVAGLVLAEVDYATDQIYLDAAAATLYGLPADVGAVSRAAVHATFHPDDTPEIFRRMHASFDPTGPGWFAMEHRVVHPDGAVRWLYVRKQVFFTTAADGTRRPIRALLAAFDITAEKATEEALRTSEERYRTLFACMEEGFCVFEMLYDAADQPVDYRFLEVNPAFARFTGLENAVGKTAYELVPNLEPYWVATYDEVARTGEARHFIEGSAAMGRYFEVYAFRFGGPASRRVALLFTDITERKLTEDALRDSEEELRYTVELNPQVPWTADPAGNIISFNQRWLDLTGLTEEQAFGGGWVQAPHPDDRPAMVAAWSHSIQSGDPYDVEHRIRLATGDYRWMRSRAFPRRDKNGALVRWYGTTEDIHERKVAEEALRDSEARLQTILHNIPASIYMLTTDQRYLYVNRHYEQLANITNAEIQGKSIYDMFDPATAAALTANDQRALAAKAPLVLEEFAPQDGIVHTYASIKAPLLNAAGEPYALIGISTDITERKMAEEALHRATARFERAERAAHGFVFEADLVTGHVIRSSNFSQITGYAQEEVPPTVAGWLALIHPDDLPLVGGGRDLLSGPATNYLGEYRVRHKAGHYIWLQEQGLIERDETGRPLAIIGTTLDITVSKEAEVALRTSEALLRQLADAMPQIVWQADDAGNNSYFNQRWLDYTGMTPADSLADANRAIHPADQAEAVRQWQEVRPLGQPYEFELRLRRADGLYRWHLTRCIPVYNDAGQLLCWYGTSTDIHDRKEAEIALQQSEARFRTLANTIPSIIWTAAPDGAITYANDQWFDYCGLAPEANANQWPQLVLHPDDFERCVTQWSDALESGEAYEIEVRNRRHDGVYRWFLTRATPLHDADGQISAWFGVTTDIDERKRTEQALRTSEERLRLATEAGGVGIFDYDSLTTRSEASTIYARIIGLPPEQAADRSRWLTLVHPEDRPIVEAIWTEAFKTGASYYYECRLIRPDGVLIWVEVNAWVTADDSGRGMRITDAVRDITERKQAALHQQFLLNLNSSLRTLTDAAAIQQTVVERLGPYLGVERCRFNAIDLAADKVTLLAAWSRPGLPPPNDITPLSASASAAYITSAQAGRTLVIQDAEQDERDEIAQTSLLSRGYAATIRVPCLREGQWVASLHVLQRTPRQWRADEVQLVESVVHHFWPIVEKARAEAELRRQEEFLRRLADNVPGLVGYLGADERYRFVNAAFEAWFQRPRRHIIGHTVAELIGEVDHHRLNSYRQQALAGERVNYETDFAYPDGVTRTVWGRYQPDVAADGRILGFYLFLMDITERKQAETDARFLADLAETIRLAGDVETLVANAIPLVGEYLNLGRALWIEVEPAQDRGVVRYQHCRSQGPTASEFRLSAYSDATRAAMDAGLPLVIHDAATDPHTADRYAMLYAPRGVGALMNVPFLHEGRWRSLLSATVATPRQWQAREVRLLETVAERIWLALEKLRAEAALRASEARFRAVQQATPDGYMIFESVRDEQGAITDFRWLYVNPASEQMVGRTAADLLGKCLLVEMPGNREEGLFDAYVQVVEMGEVYQREFCYQHEGIDRWFRNTAAKAGDGFAVAFSDITAHKEAEADQQFLAELAEQIRRAEESEELIGAAVRLMGDHLQVGRCLWIEIYAAEQRGFIHAQHCRGLPPVPETYANADYSPRTRAELTDGRVVVNHDAQQDPRTAAFYATSYAPYQERAYIGVPFLREGQWRGILSVTMPAARQWQAREIRLLEMVAERVWLAVEKLRLNAILRANEERLRQALTAASAGGWFYDLVEETTHWSPEMFDLYGLSPALGAPTWSAFAALIHPADRAQANAEMAAAVQRGGHFAIEFRVVRADGQERWVNSSGTVDLDAAGQPIAASGIDQDITVRKQAEIALQQSNAILQGVLEGSNDAIFVRDLTGRYLLVNQAGADQVGLAQSAIIGRRYQEIFDAATVAAITDDDHPVLAEGRTVTLEQVSEQKGVTRYWHTLKMPLRDAAGTIVGLISSARDFTERKTMEEALRANEARYRTIFEHAGVSLWEEDFSQVKSAVDELTVVWRAAGVTDLAAAMRTYCAAHPDFVQTMLDWVRILDVNEETVRLYGRPKVELLRPFAQHFDAETEARFVEQLVLLTTGGQRYRFDGPITTPQGETRHIAFTVVFPADADGDFTRVLLSGLDVTPLKAAEVENRRLLAETQSLLAQVQEGERFLQSIADTVPNVIYLFDLRSNCNRYANRQVAVTLGYTAEEAQALGDRLIATLLHPEDQAYLANHLAHLQALAAGEMAEWEYRMQHKSGEWRWLNSREIIFERDEQGSATVVLGVLQDITARKEAEVALRASEARFRHLAEAMPQLIWTCQADGSMTYINQPWQDYSGVTPATTLVEGMWPAIHPADQTANRKQWSQALASGEAYEGEIRLRRHDGAYRWFLERAIPVRDEAGAIQQWFGVSMDIHDRKEAEQRQAELVALLEALLANAPVGFAFLDREQRFVRINQVLADQHGCPIADHIGRTFTEIAPRAAQTVGPILAQIFATGAGIYNREISGPKVANPNEIGHALASWFPVPVHGVTQYVGSMMVDITERKRQERHQQFLNELGMDLRLLSDSETILTHLVSRLGAYLQAAGCRINEVTQAQAQFILQKDWAAADAPWPAATTPGVYPLSELAPPVLLAALQAGQTVVVANTLHDPRTAPVVANYENDQVHSLIGVPIFRQGEWRATLSVKGHGERHWRPDEVALVETVAGQLSALLEKVRAEEALRASEEIARRQLAEIEAIYATAPVGLCLVDRDLRYVRINEMLAAMNHHTVDDLLGRTLQETGPAEGFQLVAPLYQRVMATGEPLLNREVHERYVDPAQARDWLASYYPLKNAEDVVTGVNAVIMEITERKRQERELQELNATLEERVQERTKALEQVNRTLAITNRELEQFTYAAAHDLRTPLRGIANLVQWISEDAAPVLSPDSQRHLEKLGGRVKRLEKMLEDLLLYSRVGRVRYLPEAVDVQQLVQSLIDLLAPPPGFVINCATDLPTFDALRIPLDLVFRNLLSNAIRHHHAPEQGQAVITVRDLGDWYEFCVSDNGPGIDPQYHDRIFGMFQTLKPRDQVEGSGIGLALVKKMVESVGGRIWMESTLGLGTRFYFTWPKGVA